VRSTVCLQISSRNYNNMGIIMKKEISIQELKIILLETMDAIDEFCRDNGIHYFLLAGSLLGAV
jgi:hypothetical protein